MKKLSSLFRKGPFDRWIPVGMVMAKNGKVRTYRLHKCPNCGQEYAVKSNYCPECGKHLRKKGC